MIRIDYHQRFLKSYTKRIKPNQKLEFIFRQRVQQFCLDPHCPQLHNHQLTGKLKNLYSFSINGDIRLIYQWIDDNTVFFLDISSHNQVY